VILQGSGSSSSKFGPKETIVMPANLPCIPKFSDRRNGDGDVEEMVRLGEL
jgi:hypothetical protein